jgi:putative SOS response-associated peptidase YedK
MAAAWKVWKNPKTDKWEPTFAIITGDPNELMEPIHDRMTTFTELVSWPMPTHPHPLPRQ